MMSKHSSGYKNIPLNLQKLENLFSSEEQKVESIELFFERLKKKKHLLTPKCHLSDNLNVIN